MKTFPVTSTVNGAGAAARLAPASSTVVSKINVCSVRFMGYASLTTMLAAQTGGRQCCGMSVVGAGCVVQIHVS